MKYNLMDSSVIKTALQTHRNTTNTVHTVNLRFERNWFTPVSPLPEILLGTTASLNTVMLVRVQVQ